MLIKTTHEMWTSLCNFLCKKFFHKPEISLQRSNASCDNVYGKRVKLNINIKNGNGVVNQTKSCSMQEGSVDISDDDEDCCIIAEIPKRKVPGNSVAVTKPVDSTVPNPHPQPSWGSFLFRRETVPSASQSKPDEVELLSHPTGKKNDDFKAVTKKYFHTPRTLLGHKKLEKARLAFKNRQRQRVNFLQESYRLTEKLQYMQLLQSLTSHDLFTFRNPFKPIKYVNKPIEVIDLCSEKTSDSEVQPNTTKPDDQDIQIVKEIPRVRSFQDIFKIKPLNAEIAIQNISSKQPNKKVFTLPEPTINIDDNNEENATDVNENQKTSVLEEELRNFMQITTPEVEEIDTEELYYLPELTSEQERRIKQALIPEPGHEILVRGFGINITRQDMQTLVGLNWLNDEVINFYMNLIVERSKLNKKLAKVYSFNTFFYPKLASHGYPSLRRWTKQVDIFAFDILLVPIHLGMHWCLAVIDFRHKTIKYYDSVGSPNNPCLERLLLYLQSESLDKRKEVFQTTNWKMLNVEDIPQQMNGGDCGVFSCMFAEHLSRDCPILFTQDDMPYFRRKMVIEILKKKLLT